MFQSATRNHRILLLGLLVFAVAIFFYRADWPYRGSGQFFVEQNVGSCNKTTKASNVTSHDAFQWCSADSSARRMHQKVITFTLFGAANASLFTRYDSLLTNISTTSRQMYPGWIVRIYHNFRNESEWERSVLNQLDNLKCQFDHVDLCSVPELIARIPALTPVDPALLRGLNPRMLRFLVMLDPNVDVFISRDTDSVIWRREVDAVNEWLSSNYTFHLMRDHRKHNHLILAGMWGAKLDQRRDLMEGLTRALIVAGQGGDKHTDQNSLNNILWPTAQFDVMAHDSYQCQNNQMLSKSPLKVYPFPTMRNGSYYVGGIGQQLTPDTCPVACRPPDHKDWEFC
ncbi:hypothetical protein GHT06_010135 [Daphnia sinensis]|uniref:Lactosylceramide n=1 Tax=Daphnia sinensis TaxID=1820382 RepID=A0AAD5PWP5_9CRUS|nr:hypothetical protein GHT06_010135 [Daphnia sinensis]